VSIVAVLGYFVENYVIMPLLKGLGLKNINFGTFLRTRFLNPFLATMTKGGA
jgi:hypothetical protein